MKSRLYAFLIAVLILFVLIGVNSHALSTSLSPVGDLSAEASPSSELPGDTVIRFPDPNFEAAVREIIGKPFQIPKGIQWGYRGRDIGDLFVFYRNG